jgi:Na+-transporting methylmalonyl-CoA/oxaloacetate decarboxylase gamma subunit
LNYVILQGLGMSLWGMGLVFAALGIIIFSMYILDRAFRPGPGSENGGAETEGIAERGPEALEQEAVVAAIALALATSQALQRSHARLGEALEVKEPGPWTLTARSQQLRVWRGR